MPHKKRPYAHKEKLSQAKKDSLAKDITRKDMQAERGRKMYEKLFERIGVEFV